MGSCAFRQGCAAFVVAMLTACSSGTSGHTSQVVARVDDTEITVGQLSEALAARGAARAGKAPAPAVTQKAVDTLIDEALLEKAALEAGLDRDPVVARALEKARRQVLARAYAERVVFPREPVNAAQELEYYQQNPMLFAKRKVFTLMVYSVKADELPAGVRADLGKTRTVGDVTRVLASRALVYETQTVTYGAERLPLDDLTKFDAAKAGDVVILPPQQGRVALMQILKIEAGPVGLDRARPVIQQYLVNRRNALALEEYLRQARNGAKIAIFGDVSVAAAEPVQTRRHR